MPLLGLSRRPSRAMNIDNFPRPAGPPPASAPLSPEARREDSRRTRLEPAEALAALDELEDPDAAELRRHLQRIQAAVAQIEFATRCCGELHQRALLAAHGKLTRLPPQTAVQRNRVLYIVK
jgi:hypothetical protein